MHPFNELAKSIHEEKMCRKFKHISFPLIIGIAAGALAALLIIPKSKSIRMTYEDMGDKVKEAAEAGKNKASELLHEGEKKFERAKDEMQDRLNQ